MLLRGATVIMVDSLVAGLMLSHQRSACYSALQSSAYSNIMSYSVCLRSHRDYCWHRNAIEQVHWRAFSERGRGQG